MNDKEIAERLIGSLSKALEETQPLGDLNVPVNDILEIIYTLYEALEPRDFGLAMLIIAHMYGVDDEETFTKRLAKSIVMLDEKRKKEQTL